MQVILLQDVAKIGRRNEEVAVPDGYALNNLIPKKMALPATAQNRKRLAASKATKEAGAAAELNRVQQAMSQLAEQVVEIPLKANEQGHLFQAVHAADVVAAAAERGVQIEAGWIEIASPIKEVGEYTVTVAHAEESHPLQIKVVAA
jgi:large subunit ribosomal protein L9